MNKVYILEALEIIGDGDYIIGIFSSELNAIEAYKKHMGSNSYSKEYCQHIEEHILDKYE